MPIRPSEKSRYPDDWKAISLRIRERAGQQCECTGQCGDEHHGKGRCNAPNGRWILRHVKEAWRWCTSEEFEKWEVNGIRPHEWADKAVRIVLTVAHLDHVPEHCEDSNLLAMCQRCHLKLDGDQRARTAHETRRSMKAHRDLFDERNN
jgi:hypothetical protein